MKTVQKLEVFFGLATLITAVIEFYFEGIPQIKRIASLNSDTSVEGEVVRAFLFLLLPATLTFLGAYTHAVRQSKIGFILLLIGGSILVLILGIGLFSGAIFYFYGFAGGLLRVSPHFSALIAMLLAIYSKKLFNGENH